MYMLISVTDVYIFHKARVIQHVSINAVTRRHAGQPRTSCVARFSREKDSFIALITTASKYTYISEALNDIHVRFTFKTVDGHIDYIKLS